MKKVVGSTVTTIEELAKLIANGSEEEHININGLSLVNAQYKGNVRVRINDGDILDVVPDVLRWH